MKEVLKKTIKFQFLQLLPGLAALIAAALLYIPLGIWLHSGGPGFWKGFVTVLWALICIALTYFARYYGYLCRTSFLAAVAEYKVNHALPENGKDFVLQSVRGQFESPSEFAYLHGLVKKSVKELYRGQHLQDRILLGYLSWCCTCINFYKKKAAQYKNIANAVVMFEKNQKTLLADGVRLGSVIGGITVGGVLFFWLMFSLCSCLGWFCALVFGILTAVMLKYAFLDSYFLAQQLPVLGELEQMSTATFYDELSGRSSSFRKLCHKVRREAARLDRMDAPENVDYDILRSAPAEEEEESVDEQTADQKMEEIVEESGERAAQIADGHGENAAADPQDKGMESLLESVKGFENAPGMEHLGEIHEANADKGSDENRGKNGGENDPVLHSDSDRGGEDRKAGGKAAQKTEVMFCGECGAACFTDKEFCEECGAPLSDTAKAPAGQESGGAATEAVSQNAPEAKPDPQKKHKKHKKHQTRDLFCGECGAKLTPGERFCGECGAKAE